MKYMLDTNMCIYAMKNQYIGLREYMAEIPPLEMCISTITLSELKHGVYKSAAVEKNQEALIRFLSIIKVLPFDDVAADEYGKIRASLEKKGMPIGTMDTLIAGHARANGLTVVTHNTKEFSRVDNLKVEDWVEKLASKFQ